MNLGACPHCGTDIGVYQAMRVTGSAKRLWDTAGSLAITVDLPKRYIPHSDAVRCIMCAHIRRDWMAIDGELVRGEEA